MIELNKIYLGDCIEVMKEWPDNFVDTIITDPPYGLSETRGYNRASPNPDVRKKGGFMGMKWDHDVPGIPFWSEMLRICKPGAMLLSFGGTRTFHRMTVAIEDAGWEIRDCITWLYGSGFPKSHNLHDKFEGWGTALKPAWEPIIVAMKPLDGTFAQNAEKWDLAGLNVDGGRIGTERPPTGGNWESWRRLEGRTDIPTSKGDKNTNQGRWPANLILDEEAAAMLDGMSGKTKSGDLTGQPRTENKIYGSASNTLGTPRFHNGDCGGASRFFYVAKADRAERNEGCEELPILPAGGLSGRHDGSLGKQTVAANVHPTVKPLSLMKYLCNLTKTPTGGIVLDPFAGSGTTLWAAEYHNRPWIGIEQNAEYVKIARARIALERSQLKMSL